LEMAVAPTPVDVNAMLLDFQTHRASLPGKLDEQLIQAANKGRP